MARTHSAAPTKPAAAIIPVLASGLSTLTIPLTMVRMVPTRPRIAARAQR
jgi:hypothetical protein